MPATLPAGPHPTGTDTTPRRAPRTERRQSGRHPAAEQERHRDVLATELRHAFEAGWRVGPVTRRTGGR